MILPKKHNELRKRYLIPEIASEVTPICDLVFGYLRCNVLKDTINIYVKICTLRGVHTHKKDRSSQVNNYSPWRSEITPFPSLKKEMSEFMGQGKVITTPFNISPNWNQKPQQQKTHTSNTHQIQQRQYLAAQKSNRRIWTQTKDLAWGHEK